MKRISFLAIILFLFLAYASAQSNEEASIIYAPYNTTYLTKLKLQTGETLFGVPFKEPLVTYNENKQTNTIYALTKHYGYKIDGSTGEILIEYQYTDILTQEPGEPTDPNINIIPLGVTGEGIGYFSNMMEKVRPLTLAYNKLQNPSIPQITEYMKNHAEALNNTNIRVVDINAQKTAIYKTIIGGMTNYPEILEKNLIFSKNTNNRELEIEECSHYTYRTIQQFKVPIKLDGNNAYNLTNDHIYNIGNIKISDDELSCDLFPKTELYPLGVGFSYLYNLKTNQVLSIKKINSFSGANKGEVAHSDKLLAIFECPEKQPMPKAPEVFIPTRYNKKAQAEAQAINDQRLKDFQAALKIWSQKQNDNSACEVKIFEVDNSGNQTLIYTIVGTKSVTLYYDKYAFYNDGLSNTMVDLEAKTPIWSISL